MNEFTIMAIRMAERILSVGIGGMIVYFGYRLFLLLPLQNDQAGNIELPGFKVVLSKVGPGVFFVAFGTVLLLKSLSPVQIGQDFLGGVASTTAPLTNITKPESKKVTDEQQLGRVRHTLQMLNCVERTVTASKAGLREDEVEEAMRDAKISLIESVWNEKWGERASFHRWSQTQTGKIPSELSKLYESTLTDCPR